MKALWLLLSAVAVFGGNLDESNHYLTICLQKTESRNVTSCYYRVVSNDLYCVIETNAWIKTIITNVEKQERSKTKVYYIGDKVRGAQTYENECETQKCEKLDVVATNWLERPVEQYSNLVEATYTLQTFGTQNEPLFKILHVKIFENKGWQRNALRWYNYNLGTCVVGVDFNLSDIKL